MFSDKKKLSCLSWMPILFFLILINKQCSDHQILFFKYVLLVLPLFLSRILTPFYWAWNVWVAFKRRINVALPDIFLVRFLCI